MSLTYLTHPQFAPALYIKHGFFGRAGGVSTGPFSSLNIRFNSEDSLENVLTNLQRIQETFQHPPDPLPSIALLNQVHGDQVVLIEKARSVDDCPQADAMITREPGIILGIRTADCVPVLLADPQARIIGALHAGWRGTQQQIIAKTVECLYKAGASCTSLQAIIGPAIQQASYEVGRDVYTQFPSLIQEIFFRPHSSSKNHFFFDLPGTVKYYLSQTGIEHIYSLPVDTYKESERFFSCRRSYHHTQSKIFGNHLSGILLTET